MSMGQIFGFFGWTPHLLLPSVCHLSLRWWARVAGWMHGTCLCCRCHCLTKWYLWLFPDAYCWGRGHFIEGISSMPSTLSCNAPIASPPEERRSFFIGRPLGSSMKSSSSLSCPYALRTAPRRLGLRSSLFPKSDWFSVSHLLPRNLSSPGVPKWNIKF
jgi:hypothetical protein